MSIRARDGSVVRLYFDDEFNFVDEKTPEYVEVLDSLTYSLHTKYTQKMADSIVYKGEEVVKIKEEAFKTELWLLSKVVKEIVSIEEGEVVTITPPLKTDDFIGILNEFNSKFINKLLAKVKEVYGMAGKAKEEDEKDEEALGE
jgi:hypothetical protein